MKYEIELTREFKKSFRKLSIKDKNRALDIIKELADDKTLEPKYKDHKLKGEYKDFRECHIKPDLLLIYQKQDDILVLACIDIGSHSELF